MRIRQAPSGPYAGRSINCELSKWAPTIPPFITTASAVPAEVVDMTSECPMRFADTLLLPTYNLSLESDAPAIVSVSFKVRKPDNSLVNFDVPGIGTIPLTFPGPGSEFLSLSGLLYVATSSGIHKVTLLISTTLGNVTIKPPTAYSALVF